MKPQRRSHLRTALFAIGILVLVIIGLRITYAAWQGGQPRTAAPASATPSASPSATPTPTSTDNGSTADPLAAVGAAANFADVLSAAQFLPDAKRQDIVDRMVYAPQRQAELQALATSGPIVAKAWGYDSIVQVNASSGYSVSTEQYKVLEYDGNTASIALYVVTHWVNADYSEYRQPGITIVDVRLVNGEWLFVSTESPPKSEVPDLVPNLTFQQWETLYRPYLQGYERFEGNGYYQKD